MEESTQTPVVETPAATVETPAIPLEPTVETVVATPEEAPQPIVEETFEVTTGQALPASAEEPLPECAPSKCGPQTILIAAVVVLALAGILVRLLSRGGAAKASGKGGNVAAKGSGDVVEIYVGNLSYDMTEAQFRKEFERFGVVKSARIIGHRTSGKSKGYGFVEMPHRKEALVAIKALNNRDLMGRKLRVNEARNGTVPRD